MGSKINPAMGAKGNYAFRGLHLYGTAVGQVIFMELFVTNIEASGEYSAAITSLTCEEFQVEYWKQCFCVTLVLMLSLSCRRHSKRALCHVGLRDTMRVQPEELSREWVNFRDVAWLLFRKPEIWNVLS